MNGFDLSTASNIYIGGAQASAVYLGSTKIWPSGPIPPHDYSQDYLTIIPQNTAYVCYNNTQGDSQGYYSLDNGSTWNTFPAYTSNWKNDTSVQVQAQQKILIKDNRTSFTQWYTGPLTRIHCTENYDVLGNIMSLTYGDNFASQTSCTFQFEFSKLFYQEQTLVNANNLILPATTLFQNCYNDMFGYNYSLVSTPVLPATTLAVGCYENMFFGCTSLTTAPDLPAPILQEYCYAYMFAGCALLAYIKCLATDMTAPNCLTDWVKNIKRFGTFVMNGAAFGDWTYGDSGVPEDWVVHYDGEPDEEEEE